MALFAPRTFPEILSDMISTLLATTPLNDVSFGGVLVTMLEAAAQEDDEQYFQMLQLIRSFSLDTTTGGDLENRAAEFSLTRNPASAASAVVTITDTAIVKVETNTFSGNPGSAAGDTTIDGDASTGFAVAGSIIIGRGTANVETISYSSITDNGTFVTFNLSSPLASDHGTDETIIMGQGGDRLIAIGTIVTVPSTDITESVDFSLDAAATILDGESEVTDVPVTATLAGSFANVPIGSINTFDSKPFSTAVVTNPSRVTNGRDEETDQELRDRIKDHIQSLSRGTGRAITTGISGLVSDEDNKRVVSVSLRDVTLPTDVVKVFIDDGTGFIPTFSKVGFEAVTVAATGGEKFLNIDNVPVLKAFSETLDEEPYNIPDASTLFVEVAGKAETITFSDADFAAPGAATAQEVLIVINASSEHFEGRVSSEGTKVKLFARADQDEEIRVTGGTANAALNFPTDTKFTTKLYLFRDNILTLLSKDGRTASIESGATATWDFSTASHLSVVVDDKINNIQKIWFNPDDFVLPGTVNIVEAVDNINIRAAGLLATASSNDSKVTLTSNTERSSGSKIRVIEKFTSAFNEEASVNVNRTTEFGDNASSVVVFGDANDYVYLGHTDVPFDSIFVELTTPASADVVLNTEFYQGGGVLAFTQFGVEDGTLGFTQDGHIMFSAPFDWAKTTVEGVNAYWIRLQRTELTVPTPPTANKIKVCGANDQFLFSEVEIAGTDKDYTLNRFIGQIELEDPLISGDQLTLGSFETRASAVSTAGTFFGLPGATLGLTIDGIVQPVPFVAGDFGDPLAALPSEVAAVINANTSGVTASDIEGNTKVKIQVNGYTGTLQVDPASANTVLNFSTEALTSLESHVPYLESAAEPYAFSAGDTVVIVVDENFSNTFTVPVSYVALLTGVTDPSNLIDTTLSTAFPLDDEINGYEIEMTSGPQIGVRRVISDYVAGTGVITVSAPFPGAPDPGDDYEILPVNADQVVALWNNKKVTLLQNSAEIKVSDAGDRVQLASLISGEDASIQVTGGSGNAILLFGSEAFGIDSYKHFTGLAQLIQKTIDGSQDDPDTFPGIRAAGVQVEVIEPVKIPVTIEIRITTQEGVSLTTISNGIKSAISSYINAREVGGDIILSEIIVNVKAVDGVFDAIITSPTDNIAIADNELGRIVETDISVIGV
jgi:uncharacterized phage protein gp47/JayE